MKILGVAANFLNPGVPPSPGPIHLGDVCKGYINNQCLLDFKVI